MITIKDVFQNQNKSVFIKNILTKIEECSMDRELIICFDNKKEFRKILPFHIPFSYFSMINQDFFPLSFNPLKIPKDVSPSVWIHFLVFHYQKTFKITDIERNLLYESIYYLYETEGVFHAQNDTEKTEKSKLVTFSNVFWYFNNLLKEEKNNKIFPLYSSLLETQHKPSEMYCKVTDKGIDELFESKKIYLFEMENFPFVNFIKSLIENSFSVYYHDYSILIIDNTEDIIKWHYIENNCNDSDHFHFLLLDKKVKEIIDPDVIQNNIKENIYDLYKSICKKTPDENMEIPYILKDIQKEFEKNQKDMIDCYEEVSNLNQNLLEKIHDLEKNDLKEDSIILLKKEIESCDDNNFSFKNNLPEISMKKREEIRKRANSSVFTQDDIKDFFYETNEKDIVTQLTKTQKDIILLMGKEGISRYKNIEDALIESDNIGPSKVRSNIRSLYKSEIVSLESVSTPLSKIAVYNLTKLGKECFKILSSDKQPILSEAEKIINEHGTLAHGYGIKYVAKELSRKPFITSVNIHNKTISLDDDTFFKPSYVK